MRQLSPWMVAELLVLGVALFVRLKIAGASYLNPDEILHYLISRQPSLSLVYKDSLNNAHPPLLFFVLYFWRFAGNSEFALRLPSVLAGTAFAWVGYKWVEEIVGKTAGLISLAFFAFAPPLIEASAEVRQYPFLLLCIAGSLYFLMRAFKEESARLMFFSLVMLDFAVLFHYSALFVALALGCYSLVRLLSSRFPPRVVLTWASGQIGFVGLSVFLYATHIGKLRGSPMEVQAATVWLREHYFPSSGQSLGTFTVKQSGRLFQFLCGWPGAGDAALILFLIGIALLLAGQAAKRRRVLSMMLGILLVLPVAICWCASIAGAYPYGGTRHALFLAPFAVAAISFALANFVREKMWLGFILGIGLIGVCNALSSPPSPSIKPINQRRELMSAAMNALRRSVPTGEPILVDYQSSLVFGHYLCNGENALPKELAGDFFQFHCGGYSIISSGYKSWLFTPENFSANLEAVARVLGLNRGDRVWVLQAGWEAHLASELPKRFRRFRCQATQSFGKNIAIMSFVIGPG